MKYTFRILVVLSMLASSTARGGVKYVGPNEHYTSIKWAYNESAEGDTIIVKDGTYSENILIDKSIVLISENVYGAVIGSGDGTKGYIRISDGTVVVDGFTFNPNNANHGIVVGTMDPGMMASGCIIRNNQIISRNTGILISPFANATTLLNNTIRDCYQIGISMAGKGINTFTGNHVLNCADHGIFINESMEGSLLLLNDTITGNGRTGITIEGHNVTLNGSLIKDNSEGGVRTNSGRQNIVISEGNSISNNQGVGIEVESGTNMVIENNEILDNSSHGILIREGATATVSDNSINGNQFNGVMCYGSVKLSGNTLSSNVPNGIEVLGSVEMENNMISKNADLGVFIQPGVSLVMIKENLISQNFGGGLQMAAGGHVTGNTFDGNRIGINVDARDAVIYISGGNEIMNQIEHGIFVTSEGHAYIDDNDISGNGTGVQDQEDFSGIFISGSATISNNTINENGGSGIRLGPDAHHVIVSDNPEINGNREGILMNSPARLENNMILNNGNQGILAGEGADSSILKNNYVSGNRTGIVIRENVSNIYVLNCDIISNERGLVSNGNSILRRNTIQNNTAYGIRIARPGIDLGQRDEENGGYNLISNNTPWNIVNLIPDTIYACYNYWETEDADTIDSTISDNDEDSLIGPVIFLPLVGEDPTGIEAKKDPLIESAETVLTGVYPNPTSGYVIFEFEKLGLYSIAITSMNGRVLSNFVIEGTTHQLDLTSFTKGIYFITIRSKDFVTTQKVIKQ